MRARRTTTHKRWIALLLLTLIAAACGSNTAEVQGANDNSESETASDTSESETQDAEIGEPENGDRDELPIQEPRPNGGPVPEHDDSRHGVAETGVLTIGNEVIGEEVGAVMGLDPETSLPVLTVDYGEATAEISFNLPHYDVGQTTLTLANGDVFDLGAPSVGYPPTAITLEAPVQGDGSEWARFSTTFLNGTTTFEIEENRAIFTGQLGTNTSGQIQHLIDDHPEVDTLVLADIDGAVEDEIADTFGRVDPWHFTEFSSSLIRDHGFTTVIPADGRVTDSGLLLFAGGVERVVEATEGALYEQEIGELSVRADCCGLTEADLDTDSLPDQYAVVHAEAVRRWSRFLGEEAGTALALHLAQQAIGSPHELTRVELDAFGLVTTPAVLADATTPAPVLDDLTLSSLDLDITVNRPEELLEAIAERFTASRADVEEGSEFATPWVVAHGDQTVGYMLIEGTPDDAVRGKVVTLTLEGDDSFGWVVTDVSNRYICSRGLTEGLCF